MTAPNPPDSVVRYLGGMCCFRSPPHANVTEENTQRGNLELQPNIPSCVWNFICAAQRRPHHRPSKARMAQW